MWHKMAGGFVDVDAVRYPSPLDSRLRGNDSDVAQHKHRWDDGGFER